MVGADLLTRFTVLTLILWTESHCDQKVRKDPYVSPWNCPSLPKYIILTRMESSVESNRVPLLIISKAPMIPNKSVFNSLVWPVRGWINFWELQSIFTNTITTTFHKHNLSVTLISAATIPGTVSLLTTTPGVLCADTYQKNLFSFFLAQ